MLTSLFLSAGQGSLSQFHQAFFECKHDCVTQFRCIPKLIQLSYGFPSFKLRSHELETNALDRLHRSFKGTSITSSKSHRILNLHPDRVENIQRKEEFDKTFDSMPVVKPAQASDKIKTA